MGCQHFGEVGTQPLENVSTEKQENQQISSSENQNPISFPDQQFGTRLGKPTEKGREYQIVILSQKRQGCYHNLAKHLQSAYKVLDAETDLHVLESVRDTLDKAKEELNQAQSKYDQALETKEERVESYNWFDLRDREFMECRLRLIERIQCLDKIQSHLSEASSVRSGKSRRSESVASSRSARSMRLEAAAKSARLRARRK